MMNMRLVKAGEVALIKALLMTNSKLAEVIVPTLIVGLNNQDCYIYLKYAVTNYPFLPNLVSCKELPIP